MLCMHAKSLQSSLTLQPHGLCRLPGSSVHGILQARIPEWIVTSSSRGSSQPRDRTCMHYRQNSCGSGITDRLFTAKPVEKPCLMIYHRLTAENLISPSMPSQDLEESAHYPFPPQETREPLPINKRRGPGGRVRWRGWAHDWGHRLANARNARD